MGGYQPLYVKGMQTGLVQDREDFILPDDAYPFLTNAFVWRERIKRRQGLSLLGRLRRILTTAAMGNISAAGAGVFTFNIFTGLGVLATEPNAQLEPANITNIIIAIAAPINQILTDTGGTGTMVVTGAGPITAATISYATGILSLTFSGVAVASAATITGAYYPTLPVMGLRTRELNTVDIEQMIAFDTKYAYRNTSTGFIELPSGTPTTWTGNDSEFFWSTNYWVDSSNNKIFWVTNFTDPIRYYNSVTWTNFAPRISNGDALELLTNCLAMLPFRNRLVVVNTIETTGPSHIPTQYFQRIRWSAIGNPIPNPAAVPPYQPWFDDIRGQGGFLDIPTSEAITSIGFIRDNMVVYCERSTWQLRYTGRSIAPFQIERVNSELGSYSTFSSVQFDTSLVGIGDKGIVECDSYKAERIDVKIPDLVYKFSNDSAAPERIQGIRDIQQRLAYWIYVDKQAAQDAAADDGGTKGIYPNRRLVYNYENDSWAIFTDSLTALGTFQPQNSIRWIDAKYPWTQANYPWIGRPSLFPALMGGNQQGFVMYLNSNITPRVSNDTTLTITAITGQTPNPTQITSPNHNMVNGQIITISGIPLGTSFANTLNNPLQGLITGATQGLACRITSTNHNLDDNDVIEINNVGGMTQLNGREFIVTIIDPNTFALSDLGGVPVNSTGYTAYTSGGTWTIEGINAFFVQVVDANNFDLYVYNPVLDAFNIPQVDSPGTYVGGGLIALKDNFSIQSKKFNSLETGQNIQMGYVDILTKSTDQGAITLNVFMNYNTNQPINTSPQNNVPATSQPDPFFNIAVPTTQPTLVNSGIDGEKYWQRVYCPTRAAFLTITWTLSNSQMVGVEQESDVQIDSQILWLRQAGRLQTW